MSVETLCEQLVRCADTQGSRCYLLMQAPEQEQQEDDDFRDLMAQIGIEPIPIKLHKLPPALWPYLLPLDLTKGMHSVLSGMAVAMGLADKSLHALRTGRVQRACAWLWTSASSDQLVRNFVERVMVPCPQANGRRRWLRYYDPMVTDLFLRTATTEQLAYRFDGISQWAYLDRWSQLTVQQPPAFGGTADFTVDWQRVDCIGALNQAWIRAAAEAVSIDRYAFQQLQDGMHAGHRSGLRERADLDLFAWQGMTLGPRFHQHPVVQQMLATVAQGYRYDELAYRMDGPAWQRIAEESRGVGAREPGERKS